MPNFLISVCMIVKNEEEVLARCLDSINGLWDELIIVDTGSTDRTIEIAESYGAKILHYEWIAPGNKGEARNLGIDAAAGKWIVVVDADEVVCEPNAIRELLANEKSATAITVQFDNYVDGKISISWRQIRIFQRGAYRYKYREHEIPVSLSLHTAVGEYNSIFQHRTPMHRANKKSDAMIARLVEDVNENPGDPHPLYFYHRECLTQTQYEKCIELGKRYLEITSSGGFIQSEIYANMAVAYQRTSHIDKARECLHLAAACEPYNREWIYRLGVLHADCAEWNIALAMLRAAAEIQPNYERQWEPQTTTRIYQLIDHCQHEMSHALAHTH